VNDQLLRILRLLNYVYILWLINAQIFFGILITNISAFLKISFFYFFSLAFEQLKIRYLNFNHRAARSFNYIHKITQIISLSKVKTFISRSRRAIQPHRYTFFLGHPIWVGGRRCEAGSQARPVVAELRSIAMRGHCLQRGWD